MHTSSDLGRAYYRMWHQQITRASEAEERVVQAGVAFLPDVEPGGVVQPGERSFHHPAHAAESRAVVGAAADHRFHASAPQLATVLVVVNSRDRQSQSENCDLVVERQGQPTCGASSPAITIAMAINEKADDTRHLP